MQPVAMSLPAVPLSASSDMVDVRRLRLSWPVFSAAGVAYRTSPQWKRNRERLARHKLDHRLSGLSEQHVYDHYLATVQPRATRRDAGKQRTSSTREANTRGNGKEQPGLSIAATPSLPVLSSEEQSLVSDPTASDSQRVLEPAIRPQAALCHSQATPNFHYHARWRTTATHCCRAAAPSPIY